LIKFLLVLLVACTLPAQITLATNTASFRWIGENFNGGPWAPDIGVTGSGTLSQGACTGDAQLCSALNAHFSPGIAPSTLSLWTQTFTMWTFVGTAVSHLTINSTSGCASNCVIDITYVGQLRSTLWPPTIISPSGLFNGCNTKTTYNGWTFWDNDTCTWLPDQAPGGTFAFPGAGNSYTDGNFGGIAYQLTNPGFGFDGATTNSKDSNASNWNSDHSRFITEQEDGFFRIWNTASKTVEFGSGTLLPVYDYTWDCCNPDVYYYVNLTDTHIHKVVLGTGPNGWSDDANFYVYPGTGPINFGMAMQASKDNFLAFKTLDDAGTPGSGSPDRKICLLNLNDLSVNPCTTTFPSNLYSPKAVSLSVGVDSVTGYRYVIKNDVVQDGPGHITGEEFLKWKPGDVNITHWVYWPVHNNSRQTAFPGNGGACNETLYLAQECSAEGHLTMVEVDGRQFVNTLVVPNQQPNSVALLLIAAGDLMTTPVELGTGGGQYATFSICPENCDTHPSAAQLAPVVAVDIDGDVGLSNGPITWFVTAATAATPIHITVTQSCGGCPLGYSGANGDVVLIGSLYNITGLTEQVGANGLCTVANLSGTGRDFDCAGTVGGGTYTNSPTPGVVTKNVKPPTGSYQGEILIFDYTNLFRNHTYTVKRWGKMRTITYITGTLDSYYGQGHVNIDPSGTLFNYGSNFGFPSQLVMMMGSTGYNRYTITPATINIGPDASSGSLAITGNPSGAPLSATSTVPWASVSVSVDAAIWSATANTSALSRAGNFNIGSQNVPITQTGAPGPSTVSLIPSSLNFGASGSAISGPQTIAINFAGPGVAWTASSNQSNITVSPASGTGNGAFQVTVSPGPSGVITVGAPGATNLTMQVQVSVAACTYTVNPTTITGVAEGASGSITIATSTGCSALTAISNVAWASISLTGSNAVWSMTRNTGTQSRTGSFAVSGQIVPILQAGAPGPSTVSLSRSLLNFGTSGSLVTGAQTITLTFAGSALAWTASSNDPDIAVSPGSGTGNGTIQVRASGRGSGTITVSAPGATNPSLQVQVNVRAVTSSTPVGSFDTPVEGTSGIAGAIAVTGWALDNIEVTSVDIWREPIGGEPAGLVYIGDTVFVSGARPDVEAASTNMPFSYRAGWGYLLLTNFLPNNGGSAGLGNGAYRIHAIAHNKAGASVDFGAHAITADNAHASKPFGTIDTPGQGGTASGSAYLNFAWVLTQNPYMIPIDASTITVVVDGQVVGRPNYNNFRSDIASLFPGYMNSGGAVGYFYLDTTKLSNGVHTISWNAFDNLGHGEGLGSRYFNVLNTGSGAVAAMEDAIPDAASRDGVRIHHGLDFGGQPDPITADADGGYSVTMEEVGHIELHLAASSGNMLVQGEAQALPIGSALNGGVFYWQPGPGFLGQYTMQFQRSDGSRIPVRVTIEPKRYK
jgi:hypothetical protein